MQAKLNLSKVVFVRKATHPRNGVTQYGIVRSFTRPDRINHGVVKVGRRYFCSCEDFLYRHVERGTCKHIRAAKAKLAQQRSA
jgi:predicted nucleic acid-binding Zn finger protein